LIDWISGSICLQPAKWGAVAEFRRGNDTAMWFLLFKLL
jgi:hypothetical protein